MDLDTSMVDARVAAGMRFLDQHGGPGWRTLIDPARLDMTSTHNCIFGQLEGDLRYGLKKYALYGIEDSRSPHRCFAGDRDDPAFQLGIVSLMGDRAWSEQDRIDSDLTLLTDAWVRALTKETP